MFCYDEICFSCHLTGMLNSNHATMLMIFLPWDGEYVKLVKCICGHANRVCLFPEVTYLALYVEIL